MNNQSPQQYQQYPQPPSFQNDEIDLKELFMALWKGKLTIILCTLIFAVGAVAYALTAQEWWSSKAKIMFPQIHDFSEYQEQVNQYQPIFDIYQYDGTVLVSESLDSLVDPEALFQNFISAYNSSNNKKNFLDESAEFQAFKAQLDTGKKEATRKLYSEWFNKITATASDKTANSAYNISLQATTKESSYTLLNEYINSVKTVVFNDALNNLQAMVNGQRNELRQQKTILETQAKTRLAVEIERSKYALDIAKAAEVNKPIQNMGSNELFAIELGSRALDAKIKALKSVRNLTVIEPRLQQIDAKLEMLKNMKIDRNIKFQTFRYLENVEQPFSRDKPKHALIVVLGTLLGGMLGVAIVLVRFAFRKEDAELKAKS
ncbi:LPS O-antigen chain length determinant protein WzzB [Aliivibrio finisterrensis]|uniref:LPS chain length-determining protein n=1 Tax=Aliivibrio finisterrensis TaxID=511998 RepID=A0ABY0I263_9GAMM|nr:Wzz/FepE/Etk N-terminal domain-containing protein [Aliivibrio finisterrensis]RYU61820.1 LPS chain length-determining protein [Aliivibrio finisterrensis]RYU80696.1 LPS chain length-determining protein [Aliivibrio finisterrensis]